MTTPQITTVLVPPLRSEGEAAFTPKAEAFVTDLPTAITEINTVVVACNDYAVLAAALSNYAGVWSTLTGALSAGASVYHSSVFWVALVDIADVTASTPVEGATWAEVATRLASTITNGDTTHAVTGDAIYDALALKAPLTSPSFTTPNIGVASGTSLTTGSTTYASRSITSATGGVLNVALGSAAGDDFTIDGTKFVVKGDTGRHGIGTASPQANLELSDPTGSTLLLYRDDAGIQDGNNIGNLTFGGADEGAPTIEAAQIIVKAAQNWDVTNTATDMFFAVTPRDSTTLTTAMTIQDDGNVGIGTTTPNQKLTVDGSMSLADQSSATADTAGYGQIWVSNATPDELWFTDDAGTDTQISSHPMDAPEALYTNGPGLDWIGVKRHNLLGIIQWQTMDGTITEETFEAYNLRRKDVTGHNDLIKKDYQVWIDKRIDDWKKFWIKENTVEIETTIEDITEAIQIDALEDEVVSKTTFTKTKHKLNPKTGTIDLEISVEEKPVYKIKKVTEYRLKDNCMIDEKTGRVFKKITPGTEAVNKAIENEFSTGLPDWMQARINNIII